jgi:FkbM family methyltransferase
MNIKRVLFSLLYKSLPYVATNYKFKRTIKSLAPITEEEKLIFRSVLKYCKVVVDVGARTDTFYADETQFTTKQNFLVLLIEVNPLAYEILKNKTSCMEHVKVINSAISDSNNSSGEYFWDSQSFLPTNNFGAKGQFKIKKPITFVSLTDIIKDYKITKIDFLKTDLEGMDFLALIGLGDHLQDISFIQFELGLGAEYGNKVVVNQDYWQLLEKDFNLFILKDKNSIFRAYPHLPLLLHLDSTTKILINCLQKTGEGFNIYAINKSIGIPVELQSQIMNL